MVEDSQMIRALVQHEEKVRNRLGMTPPDDVGFRQVPVCIQVLRTQPKRFLEVLDCLVRLAQRKLGRAEIRQRFGALGVDPDGKPLESVAEVAHRTGRTSAIISSVSPTLTPMPSASSLPSTTPKPPGFRSVSLPDTICRGRSDTLPSVAGSMPRT